MTSTHRTLAGDWELCARPEKCELLFHFPDMSPAELTVTPIELLLPLFEVVQPPTQVNAFTGMKTWGYLEIRADGVPRLMPHREYGLPAVISADGDLRWCLQGVQHRDGDKPSLADHSGSREWRQQGALHRVGAPALIHAQYKGGNFWYVQWWEDGMYVSEQVVESPRPEWLQVRG